MSGGFGAWFGDYCGSWLGELSGSPAVYKFNLMRWNGSDWIRARLDRFDGDNWVASLLKYWDGSNWQTVGSSG